MRSRLVRLVFVAAIVAGAVAVPSAADPSPFGDCEPEPAPAPVVGRVTCRQLASASLGGTTAFSYFVPPSCDPAAHSGRRCPTLYLLHGFGGDYRSMLGTGDEPSAWVKALSSGPPRDPGEVADPWTMSDPASWVPREPIGFILVAPHGATLDGGFGPIAGVDGFWTDWNPRFARGGDAQRYDTPPPRFESFITTELIPYVEAHLPAGAGREWRALAGTSLGGFGSYKNGLQHPDLWSSLGSVSGAHNFLFAPAPDPVAAPAPAGVAPPVAVPYRRAPSVPSQVPLTSMPEQLRGFAVSFLVFGDPAADQAQYRGNMPRDLAMNARAGVGDETSLHIRGFVNDAVPRRAEDFANPASYLVGQAFEGIVLPMNVEMDLAFELQGVERSFEIHPGIHSGAYWNPFLRTHLEEQHARVRHHDGTGDPPPAPTLFDYRSISTDFEIWGWRFAVAREPVEFLTLRDVSCAGLTLRGSGVVTATAPSACGSGVNGSATFTVDLGPSFPTDEPGGAGAFPLYGRTVDVRLDPL